MSSSSDIRILVAIASVVAGALTACGASSSGGNASSAGTGGSSGAAGASSAGSGGSSGAAANAGTGGTTSAGAGGASATGGSGGSGAGGSAASSNVIATALFHPVDVQIYGTDVYWTTQGSGINKIPLAGGNPAKIVTDPDPKALAVDGTGIYWIGGDVKAVMHAGLDGSNPTMLAPLDAFNGRKLGLVGTQLFFAGKVGAASGILTLATSGGTPTALYPSPFVNGLDIADAKAGLVWEELQPSPPATALVHAALDGANPTPITTVAVSSKQYIRGASSDGATIYYGIRDQAPSPNQGYLFSAPAAGGVSAKVFTFTGNLTESVADANGAYFGDDLTASAGVYKAGADGMTKTLITLATEGNARFLRLDASHVVWMTGDDSGQSRLHVAAR